MPTAREVKDCLSKSGNLISGLIARLLFLCHSVICTFIAVSTVHHPYVYLLFTPTALIVLESFVTLKTRQNAEWKWLTPSIAIYQLCTVPSIWMMEYQNYFKRNSAGSNSTACVSHEQEELKISTNISSLASAIESYCDCGKCVGVMEQLLLMLMIVGRWLLPRGEHLSRDQKAQLLLVNIAIASDIVDLFEMMKEDQIKSNFVLVTVILCLWTASITQFAIVTTATAKKAWKGCGCFETEMWALVTLLFLDDAPFLIFRLVCIIKFEITSYTTIFFTAKNCLVLALDINRMYALGKVMAQRKKRSFNVQLGDTQSSAPLTRDESELEPWKRASHIRR